MVIIFPTHPVNMCLRQCRQCSANHAILSTMKANIDYNTDLAQKHPNRHTE